MNRHCRWIYVQVATRNWQDLVKIIINSINDNKTTLNITTIVIIITRRRHHHHHHHPFLISIIPRQQQKQQEFVIQSQLVIQLCDSSRPNRHRIPFHDNPTLLDTFVFLHQLKYLSVYLIHKYISPYIAHLHSHLFHCSIHHLVSFFLLIIY